MSMQLEIQALINQARADASRSDPRTAAMGRAGLAMSLAFLQWFEAERARGLGPEMIDAFNACLGSAIAGFIDGMPRKPGTTTEYLLRFHLKAIGDAAGERLADLETGEARRAG